MRDKLIDEFEDLFEHASIPVLDIQELQFRHVDFVLTGSDLDASVIAMARYFQTRFGAEADVFYTPAAAVVEQARAAGLQVGERPFDNMQALLDAVQRHAAELVVVPYQQLDQPAVLDMDVLIQHMQAPVLFLKQGVAEPAAIFQRVLHCLTGNFRQEQNFSYSFSLMEKSGHLELVHVVNEEEIDDVRAALQLAPKAEGEDVDQLLERLAQHGQRYLRGVVAAGASKSYDVSYRFSLGKVVDIVKYEITAGDYGLLVVGSHRDGRSHVTAEDYRLLRAVDQIAVLAL